VNGIAVALKTRAFNRAHQLIENAMIAANVCVTRYLIENKLPTLQRIVRTPQRWGRIVDLAKNLGGSLPPVPDAKALRGFLQRQQQADPFHFPDLSLAIIKLIGRGEYAVGMPGEPSIGHFDLALHDYSHATAPNRRFPDMIVQRLLKSHLYGDAMAYTLDELKLLAGHCTQKEDDASKVERRMHKSAAAMVLAPKIGQSFKAMVTGASEKGTWVRLFAPPIEGKLVQGFQGLDVGDYLTVKLIHIDIQNGYIDFAHIS
jgi:exoribonuclease-2